MTDLDYHCRLKYLWRGALAAAKDTPRNASKRAPRTAVTLLRSLSPFLLLALVARLMGEWGPHMVALLGAKGPLVFIGLVAVMTLGLLGWVLVRGVLRAYAALKALCYQGWLLSREDVATESRGP